MKQIIKNVVVGAPMAAIWWFLGETYLFPFADDWPSALPGVPFYSIALLGFIWANWRCFPQIKNPTAGLAAGIGFACVVWLGVTLVLNINRYERNDRWWNESIRNTMETGPNQASEVTAR